MKKEKFMFFLVNSSSVVSKEKGENLNDYKWGKPRRTEDTCCLHLCCLQLVSDFYRLPFGFAFPEHLNGT